MIKMKRYYKMPKWASKLYLKRTRKNKYLINAYSRITEEFLNTIDVNENECVLDVGTCRYL
jgi:hypothetical protein